MNTKHCVIHVLLSSIVHWLPTWYWNAFLFPNRAQCLVLQHEVFGVHITFKLCNIWYLFKLRNVWNPYHDIFVFLIAVYQNVSCFPWILFRQNYRFLLHGSDSRNNGREQRMCLSNRWRDKIDDAEIFKILFTMVWTVFDRTVLFVWFDYLRPINNLSDIKEQDFLGWTSSMLVLMCIAQRY